MPQLDETDMSKVNTTGRDVHVIDQKQKVVLNGTDKFVNIGVWFLFIIGGVVYTFRKQHARSYFMQLEQKIQHDASTIDNYMEQRVVILQNTAKLVEKAIDLDKTTFTAVAQARAGVSSDPDVARNQLQQNLDKAEKSIDVVLERYPDLKAHQEIADAMQQNSYLQQEITAAREQYNDSVQKWNTEIFSLWAKKYVAAKEGYTTRIPFTASLAMKQESEGVFF